MVVDPARLGGHILSTDGAFCMHGRLAYIVAVPAPVALGAHGAYQSSSPQAPACDSAADECRYLLGTQSFLLSPE